MARFVAVIVLLLVGCSTPTTPRISDTGFLRQTQTDGSTRLEFAAYQVVVHHADPFGITDLRLAGDPRTNLADGDLPLGDWEWLQSLDASQPRSSKLLDAHWPPPRLQHDGEQVILRFERPHALRQDVHAKVVMSFDPDGRFRIEYGIDNQRDEPLSAPYVMLGFPGFSSRHSVAAFGNGHTWLQMTPGTLPEPTRNSKGAEVTLLADTLATFSVPMISRIRFGDSPIVCQLTARFSADETVAAARGAHVNKRRYLTSHLYLWLHDIPPRQQRWMRIEYELSATSRPVPRRATAVGDL